MATAEVTLVLRSSARPCTVAYLAGPDPCLLAGTQLINHAVSREASVPLPGRVSVESARLAC